MNARVRYYQYKTINQIQWQDGEIRLPALPNDVPKKPNKDNLIYG